MLGAAGPERSGAAQNPGGTGADGLGSWPLPQLCPGECLLCLWSHGVLLLAEGDMQGVRGPKTVGMWRGPVPPAPSATQLSPPRPGDRIMLVDDSNEDWWKVT